MEIAEKFLGSGYNVCGHYADAESVKRKIFDLDRVPKESKHDLPNQLADYYSFDGKSVEEYQEKLSAKVQMGGTYQLFSGSVESSFDMSHMSTKESSFVTIELYQRYRTCKLQTTDQKYMYASVLEDFNTQDGKWLIEEYGSCVLMGIDVGGRWTDSLTVSKLFTNSTYEVKTKMEAAYGAFISGSGDTSVSTAAKDEKSIVTRKVRAIGGDPSKAPDHLDDWKASVGENLDLVDFTEDGLVPIWKIFPQHEEKLKSGFEEFVSKHQLKLKEKYSVLDAKFVIGHKLKNFDILDKLEIYEPLIEEENSPPIEKENSSKWKYVGHNGNNNKILMLKETVEGYGALCKPVSWQHVWNNRHRAVARVANLVGLWAMGTAIATVAMGYTSCWIPVAPPGYVALGAFCRVDVRWKGKGPPTDEESKDVVVVHESFVEECTVGNAIYDRDDVIYYKLRIGELPHNTLWPLSTDDPDAGPQLPPPYTITSDYVRLQ